MTLGACQANTDIIEEGVNVMNITNITAQVKEGDGVTVNPNFAEVVIELDNGEKISFVIHQSRCYQNTLNVEIDGSFCEGDPELRINLNDNLIADSVLGITRLPDNRPTDLDDDEPSSTEVKQ